MDLVRLVYHSRSRLDGQMRPIVAQVDEIVEQAVTNNRRRDVTGGLVYAARWFIQVIEGSEAAISHTFENILRDPRHGAVTLVNMQPIGTRRFSQWWMAIAGWSESNDRLFRQYSDGSAQFDPQFVSAERLIDLSEAVLRHAGRRHGTRAWALRETHSAA